MDNIERVLVIVPAQLGDVLISTPLIRAARTRWPHARIDVLGIEGSLELLSGNPDVDGWIEVSRRSGWRAQLRQAAALWRRYDLALVTRTSDRAHLYAFVAARLRSGLVPAPGQPGSRWKRRLMDHAFLMGGQNGHYVLEKLQTIRPWAQPPAAVSLVPPRAEALPQEVQALLRQPRVVVQVASMWRYKQWPVGHFRQLVEQLLADGVQVVLTGSASSNDRALVAAVAEVGTAPALLDVAGRLSLAQVRSVMEGAAAYVGPDTSVTHLAATLDMPVVTLYGPSLPDAFGAWPQGHPPTQPWQRRGRRQQVGNIVLLQGDDLPGRTCVPCGRMGCAHRLDSDSHCLQTLTPERVLAEVRKVMGR